MEKSMWLYSLLAAVLTFSAEGLGRAEVKPGDTITKDNLAQAEELLTPSTRWMVERGMPLLIIETKKVEWPRAYREATEKYAAQVKIAEDGRDIAKILLANYSEWERTTANSSKTKLQWGNSSPD